MLDAQADEVTEEMYLRPYDNSELVEKREEYVKLSIEMANIKAEEDEVRAEFKERKDPITKQMNTLLSNIRQGGENVRGKLYKIVDQDERVPDSMTRKAHASTSVRHSPQSLTLLQSSAVYVLKVERLAQTTNN